jgi:hypothetical protein
MRREEMRVSSPRNQTNTVTKFMKSTCNLQWGYYGFITRHLITWSVSCGNQDACAINLETMNQRRRIQIRWPERERDLYAGVHLLHTITSQIYAGSYLLRHLLWTFRVPLFLYVLWYVCQLFELENVLLELLVNWAVEWGVGAYVTWPCVVG